MIEPVVTLSEVVVLLDRHPALAGVDLEVGRGEAVLLQGPNGAGKTTVLRALAGLLPVVAGEAWVLGHDLRRNRRAVRRSVGLLGAAGGLYEDLSASENARFWTRAAGRPASAVAPALARLGLVGRLGDVPVARLSTGQRRRASLAVLVARDPELWLLDEPHAGLDAAGRDLVDDLLAEVVGRGSTAVFASHELDRAEPVATRSVTLAGGTVVERVEPAQRSDGIRPCAAHVRPEAVARRSGVREAVPVGT